MVDEGEEFTGNTSAMRAEARWLGAEDIAAYGDLDVEIVKCKRYKPGSITFDGGIKNKKEVFTLVLKRGEKQFQKEFIIGPQKRRPIVRAYGTVVTEWIGKRITLYVDYSVPKFGSKDEKTWGIRVREIEKKPA
jgi:hypothetical protein